MISLSRISSRSAAPLALLLLAQAAAAATVSGTFILADSKDPSVKKKNYAGVAAWLEPVSAKPPVPAARTFTILQKDKRFTPHVLAVPVGSYVDFPNLDPIFHNAFSDFAGQPFDTGLYAPGTSQKIRFTREGIVRVFCNIHAAMSAVIAVLNTPWYAVTAANGQFRIENVPAGEYRLHVWHERATEETLGKLTRTVTVAAADLALPPITISEAGYVVLPHHNKHGKEYPPEPPATIQYSGFGK